MNYEMQYRKIIRVKLFIVKIVFLKFFLYMYVDNFRCYKNDVLISREYLFYF